MKVFVTRLQQFVSNFAVFCNTTLVHVLAFLLKFQTKFGILYCLRKRKKANSDRTLWLLATFCCCRFDNSQFLFVGSVEFGIRKIRITSAEVQCPKNWVSEPKWVLRNWIDAISWAHDWARVCGIDPAVFKIIVNATTDDIIRWSGVSYQ